MQQVMKFEASDVNVIAKGVDYVLSAIKDDAYEQAKHFTHLFCEEAEVDGNEIPDQTADVWMEAITNSVVKHIDGIYSDVDFYEDALEELVEAGYDGVVE